MARPLWLSRANDLLQPLENRPWLLAISGGCDSMALYAAIVELFPSKDCVILHVNHQIQSCSAAWEQFVAQQAAHFGHTFRSTRLNLKNHSENEARMARYQFFKEQAEQYPGAILLMAHHEDDANETALWRFLRGSSLAGILGIQQQRFLGTAVIIRPLLHVSKNDLRSYLLSHGLGWVDDPSNHTSDYTRNFLRHQLIEPAQQRGLNQIAHSRQRLHDDYHVLQNILNPFTGHPRQLRLSEYPYQTQPASLRSLIQHWLHRHEQNQPSYAALSEFVAQILHGSKKSLLQLSPSQYLAYDRGIIWREHALWWQQPVPEPLLTEEITGSWGLFSWSGLQSGVQIRRLRKSDSIAGMKATEYWSTQQIPPWRRPFYPVAIAQGKIVQYADIYQNNTVLCFKMHDQLSAL